MRKRKTMSRGEVETPIENLPLEAFKGMVDFGLFEGEVPFDFLAEHYPELLEEWYPGYPGAHRLSTSVDPVPSKGPRSSLPPLR